MIPDKYNVAKATMFEKATMNENQTHVSLSPDCDWTCNNCGWLIAGTMVNLVRYDYGCPRCKNSFLNFTPKEKVKKDGV